MKSFFISLGCNIVAVYIGLVLAGIGLFNTPVTSGEIGEGLVLLLIEAIVIGVPYGILWYLLSIYSPRLRSPKQIIPVVAVIVFALQSWAGTNLSVIQGDFTLEYEALGIAVLTAAAYAAILKTTSS
jgi:hypothetical protein